MVQLSEFGDWATRQPIAWSMPDGFPHVAHVGPAEAAQAEAARAEALNRRPPAPVGFMYFDEAAARVSELKGHDDPAKIELSKRLLRAIAGGRLRAKSARLDVPADSADKIDRDDCLVELATLADWAGVDFGQQPQVNSASAAAATHCAQHPDVPVAKRRDAIAPLIERACREVGWPWEVATVFPILKAWASATPPIRPLLTATAEAILYEDEGPEKLTKANLKDRLGRMRSNAKAAPQSR